MKTSLTYRFATLGLIAALATPALATQTDDAPAQKTQRNHIVLSLGDGEDVETFDIADLAVGQSRQIQREDGKLVTLTRAVDALTIQSDDKTIRVRTPAPGEYASRVRIAHEDGGEDKREVVILRGNADIDALDDALDVDLEEVLDSIDMGSIETALSGARIALSRIDLNHVGDALDAIDLEGLDAQIAQTIAQARDEARTEGRSKVLVIRSKRTEASDAP